MTLSIDARPLDGCLFESSPVTAAEVMASPDASLPNLVDLREHCSRVEDQEATNSCTANAIVGALEYHQRRAGLGVTDLSRMFVYYNARQLAGSETKDVGSFIHHVMAAVLAHGACEERLWPFQKAMCTTRPTESAYRDAQRFQAVQYARTPLGNATMAALASGLPVVFGTYIPKSHYDEAGRTGRMPAAGDHIERPGSGHAMLLVGYDRSDETWLVRNSWGEGYADKGYFKVPMSTLAKYSDPSHFWTIGAIANAPYLGALSGTNAGVDAGLLAGSHGTSDSVRGGSLDSIRDRARGVAGDLARGMDEKNDAMKKSMRDRLRGD